MLYASICWIAYPNLLVKSRIDSSSRLKMVCSELMFPFFRTEHKYWETKAAHNSLNKFMDPLESLWNQARAGPFRQAGNTVAPLSLPDPFGGSEPIPGCSNVTQSPYQNHLSKTRHSVALQLA